MKHEGRVCMSVRVSNTWPFQSPKDTTQGHYAGTLCRDTTQGHHAGTLRRDTTGQPLCVSVCVSGIVCSHKNNKEIIELVVTFYCFF